MDVSDVYYDRFLLLSKNEFWFDSNVLKERN
jgi:hypothetical protein